MACRAKHRIQPCEPKPRPAEARRIYKSPFLTGLAPRASARKQHSADRSRARELKPACALSERSERCLRSSEPSESRSANLRAGRLRPAQHCELQNRQKPAVKQPHANNYSLSILSRHYAASGLLNLLTTLAQAVACTTPGVKLRERR